MGFLALSGAILSTFSWSENHPAGHRGHFPSDEAATKLIWLALRNTTADWSRASRDWKAAMNHFALIYEDRFTLAR